MIRRSNEKYEREEKKKQEKKVVEFEI